MEAIVPDFACAVCGKAFALSDDVLARFPGWTPRYCMAHRKSKSGSGSQQQSPASEHKPPSEPRTWNGTITRLPPGPGNLEGVLTPEQVLERYTAGPQTGLFTDGAARPNPGPGGWGWVHVQEGAIVAQGHGSEAFTTNNRMELQAIIAALESLPAGAKATLYSDSNLCVQTLTTWAAGWEKRGWKKKDGEVKNLDLVQRAWALKQARKGLKLQWIKAHDGSRWNEYVDALACSFLRE
jgi:ribonuclease HI